MNAEFIKQLKIEPTKAYIRAHDKRNLANKTHQCIIANDLSACVYLWEKELNGQKRYLIRGYVGKRTKPSFTYYYPSEEKRHDQLKKFFSDSRKPSTATKKKEQRQTRALSIGDVLRESIGARAIVYYKVTGLVGKNTVRLIEIEETFIRSDGNSFFVVPNTNKTKRQEFTRRVGLDGTTVKIRSNSFAHLKKPETIEKGEPVYKEDFYLLYD